MPLASDDDSEDSAGMSVIKEDLGNNLVRLTVTVPPEVFQENIERAYRKQRRSFSRPGFRKGNVPRAVIEADRGPDTFYRAALDLLLPTSLQQAYEEANIDVVSAAEAVNVESISQDSGVTYVVEVYVMPEVELGTYEGIDVVDQIYTVTDSDVEDEIERIRSQNVRWVSVERGAAAGDRVLIDFIGKVDGVAFDGGSGNGVKLELGAGTTIPGFEDGILGMLSGEDRNVDVTFPEDYAEADLAGVGATFSVHVHEVSEPEYPVVDDDFAQDVSGLETLQEYREDVRRSLQSAYDHKKDADLEAQLLMAVVQASTLNVPPPMIEQRVEQDIADMQLSLARQGVPLELYLEAMGLSLEQLKEQLKPDAERQVRTSLVLGKLVEELDTSASEEDVDVELAKRATMQDRSTESVLHNIKPEERVALQQRLTVQNTLVRLKKLSNITQKVLQSLDEFDTGNSRTQGEQNNSQGTDTEQHIAEE